MKQSIFAYTLSLIHISLGSYIFMLSSSMLRIFINPARETSDIAEFLSFILLIGFLQKSFQYLQVQAFFLCRIIRCRLVSPRRKVKEKSFLADKKVMIGQLVMVRYRPGRIGTPELVDVISLSLIHILSSPLESSNQKTKPLEAAT